MKKQHNFRFEINLFKKIQKLAKKQRIDVTTFLENLMKKALKK